jgi:hypothetical protein
MIGITMAIGGTVIGGTFATGGIMKVTTTTTSITASTAGLGIPPTAASPVVVTGASTVEAARTEWEAAASMVEAVRTEWEAAALMGEAAVTAKACPTC